jgi:hypothetical protein
VRLGVSVSDGGGEDGGGGLQVMVGVLAGRLCKSQNPDNAPVPLLLPSITALEVGGWRFASRMFFVLERVNILFNSSQEKGESGA